jgi:hypothetical protein
MDEWHCMQVAAGGMPSVSPGSGLIWHILHAIFMVPAWALWLNGKGCSGASAAVATRTAASANSPIPVQTVTVSDRYYITPLFKIPAALLLQ